MANLSLPTNGSLATLDAQQRAKRKAIPGGSCLSTDREMVPGYRLAGMPDAPRYASISGCRAVLREKS